MAAERLYKEAKAKQIQRDKQEMMDLNQMQAFHKQLHSVM